MYFHVKRAHLAPIAPYPYNISFFFPNPFPNTISSVHNAVLHKWNDWLVCI